MISTLPRSVSEQSRQAWEANHLQKEDLDASSTQDASESDLSYISEADSSTSRKHKLKKLTCNKDQMEHLRAIKRQAQRRLYNIQYKGSGGNAKHLQGLVGDISATLGQWPSPKSNTRWQIWVCNIASTLTDASSLYMHFRTLVFGTNSKSRTICHALPFVRVTSFKNV